MEHNQFTIKTFMSIMAERDAAIRERNMALEERKRAFAERDMAMLQRDAALTERNSAIQERNEAIATFQFRESLMNNNNLTPSDLTGAKQIHTDDEMNHMFDSTEAKYSQREITGVPIETARPKKVKRTNEKKAASTKPANSLIMGMKGAEDLSKQITTSTSNGWKNEEDLGGDEENLDKDDSWLNQVNFEESALPVPVCSCTGVAKPCYKWGNGGWQSACCTTAMSANLLPQVSNKRYSRVGARKMSGNVFAKLLNRLADEGHDLSAPLDLKDHWAKHGTNRYSSLK